MKRDIRIEFPSVGATYHRNEFGVYEYSEYPRSSVLAGQERRVYMDSFATLAEAKAVYPDAEISAPGFTEPDLSHLPDDEDY